MSEVSVAGPSTRLEPGWLPYVAPYFAFMLIVQFQSPGWVEHSLLLRALQVLVPGGLLVHYARRGAFPELRGFHATPGGVTADVLLGIAIGALWVAPFEAGWLHKPEGLSGLDPDQFGTSLRPVVLGLRLAGFAVVTPFMEELFVRSFLIRAMELVRFAGGRVEVDFDSDFRDLPVARFAWKGFVGTVVFFTFTHLGWQWPAAFVTGVVWNLWLYHRGHIVPLVISHAAANLSLFLLTVFASGRLHDAQGRLLDLWYQL
jgi:hypothetical protein